MFLPTKVDICKKDEEEKREREREREREQSICLEARDDPGIVMQVAFTSRVVGRMSLGKVDS